jgi:hypothetical protein
MILSHEGNKMHIIVDHSLQHWENYISGANCSYVAKICHTATPHSHHITSRLTCECIVTWSLCKKGTSWYVEVFHNFC